MNEIQIPEEQKNHSSRKRSIVAAVVLTAGLSLTLFLSGCGTYGFGGASGSGNLITQEPNIQDFTQVEASSAFDVTVTRSADFKVVISADDNLQDKLDVRKEGDILKLDLKPGSYRNIHVKAEVSMPALSGIELSGASTARLSGFDSNDKIDVNMSGASRLTGDIRSGDMGIEASGASDAELSGSAGDLVVRASGSSDVNLAELEAQNADVHLSGASSATVNPSGRLTGEASGASTIWYTGNPELGRIETSGASDVKKR